MVTQLPLPKLFTPLHARHQTVYNLLPTDERCRSAAGKVTVGLIWHSGIALAMRYRYQRFIHLQSQDQGVGKGDEHTRLSSCKSSMTT